MLHVSSLCWKYFYFVVFLLYVLLALLTVYFYVSMFRWMFLKFDRLEDLNAGVVSMQLLNAKAPPNDRKYGKWVRG